MDKTIIKPTNMRPEMISRVKIEDVDYIAGARNAHHAHTGSVYASLYLDKVVIKEKSVWNPRLNNLFARKKRRVENFERQMEVGDLMITHYDFTSFIEGINAELASRYRSTMSRSDISTFFGEIYSYYKNFRIGE